MIGVNIMRQKWADIVAQYPSQWVGLVDVKFDKGLAIDSAVVKFTEKDMDPNEMAMETMRGNLFARYTTPDEGNPVGALMVG